MSSHVQFSTAEEPSPQGAEEDEGVVETDPTGRFSRYDDAVGQGTFKRVFKAFDKHRGVDVAWNRIGCGDLGLTEEEFDRVLSEVALGRLLNHRNVIKCYRCWADRDTKTVNYITVCLCCDICSALLHAARFRTTLNEYGLEACT